MTTRQEERDQKREDKAERGRLADEALKREQPWYEERGIGGDGPEINPLTLPVPVGAAYTVTVPNPTPPTNISYISYGTGPIETMVPNVDGHGAPTYSGDCALLDTLNDSVLTPASITTIAADTGTGPAHEGTPNTTVTAPGSRTECPTISQSVTQSGSNAYTTTPNATHASAKAPAVTPTITGYVPASPVGNGGSTSLLVNGTGFYPSSQVVIGGVPYNTQYNSATQLMVQNAPKRTSAGNTAIYVVTNGTAIAPTNWVFS